MISMVKKGVGRGAWGKGLGAWGVGFWKILPGFTL